MAKPGNMFSSVLGMMQHAVAVFLSRETPWYVKLLLGVGLLYIISPYDLIPEWTPVIGIMDDLALAALLLAWASGFRK
jgi:uncharacterized membrane protein YkvA (DUF1232 family)